MSQIRQTVQAVSQGTSQVATFPGPSTDLVLVALVLRGPKTPVFNVWSPNFQDPLSLRSTTPNGDINHGTFDPPISVPRGSALYCEWTQAAGQSPVAYAVATFERA